MKKGEFHENLILQARARFFCLQNVKKIFHLIFLSIDMKKKTVKGVMSFFFQALINL